MWIDSITTSPVFFLPFSFFFTTSSSFSSFSRAPLHLSLLLGVEFGGLQLKELEPKPAGQRGLPNSALWVIKPQHLRQSQEVLGRLDRILRSYSYLPASVPTGLPLCQQCHHQHHCEKLALSPEGPMMELRSCWLGSVWKEPMLKAETIRWVYAISLH